MPNIRIVPTPVTATAPEQPPLAACRVDEIATVSLSPLASPDPTNPVELKPLARPSPLELP
jgi:hypothetical protein